MQKKIINKHEKRSLSRFWQGHRCSAEERKKKRSTLNRSESQWVVCTTFVLYVWKDAAGQIIHFSCWWMEKSTSFLFFWHNYQVWWRGRTHQVFISLFCNEACEANTAEARPSGRDDWTWWVRGSAASSLWVDEMFLLFFPTPDSALFANWVDTCDEFDSGFK